MKSWTRTVFVFAGVLTLGACASTSAVNPTGVASPASIPGKAVSQANIDPDKGFRKVTRGDTTYYCRKEGVTGSRLAQSQTCLTEEQMARARQNALDLVTAGRGNPGATGAVNAQGGQMIGATAQ